MKLGDFFVNATHARPVNPKPVTFTAIAKGLSLPGGGRNPSGRHTAATVKAALVFSGSGIQDARFAAREYLREKFKDPKTKQPQEYDPFDFTIEETYQMIQRVVYEYDETTKQIGGPLFDTVDLARDLLEYTEANRLMGEYYAYVREEHPEGVDPSTFRGSDKAG
jgi:hypothetical protein